jgi:hypothetical protein
MNYPLTDNCCTRMNWKEYEIHMMTGSLHVSVDPLVDLDGEFMAFCHDEQEMIRVSGWLIDDFTEVE